MLGSFVDDYGVMQITPIYLGNPKQIEYQTTLGENIMRGLSIAGLVVTLAVVGWLMTAQMKSTSGNGTRPAPTAAIDRANEAADQVENQAEQLQQTLDEQSK